MSNDWHPSQYKPRGGWRASLPRWGSVIAILIVGGYIGLRAYFLTAPGEDWSFKLMMGIVAVIAVACVAPQTFSSGKLLKPGEFPTQRNDETPHSVDDAKT